MSRWLKWAYSVVFFLLMCGLVAAGSYQYKDNLSIPYNINLFNCVSTPLSVSVSCTSMTLQNSGGVEIFTASNPGSVTLTNSSVTLSGSPVSVGVGDGSDSTQGAKADTAATNGFSAASVIALLKGILNNVVTPISVTGTVNTTPSGSPQNVTVANQATVNAVIASSPANVTIVGSPQNVTVANTVNATTTPATSPGNVTVNNSPLAVSIASSPVNITGNITTTAASPTTVNVGQVQNVNIASPSTYGVAPVGSVLGTNAFVTNNVNVTPPTPLNVTVGNVASPAGVAVVNNVAVTTPTPLGVTFPASPISVGIAGPTPLNVTISGPTPIAVTLPSTPVSVAISTVSSPVNVTGTFTANSSSPTTVNLNQIAGNQISSPTSYGVAPSGSVGGVNAFVTNSPTVVLSGSPVSVGIASGSSPVNVTGNFSTTVNSPLGVTPFSGASPQNVTLSASPVSVAISTVSSPLNVTGTFTANSSSPTTVNIEQIQNVNVASPSTYGVAPVGSVGGVNAFVTNNVNVTPPTPLGITLPASPISVAIAGPTPLAVTLPSTPVLVAISTVSSPVNVTGTFTANSSSPTNVNLDQVNGQLIASPQTYGTAPVGSVLGVNAFVTSLPASPLGVAIAGPTPLNVTVGNTASPAGVAVVNNVSVTTPTPLQVTLPASPISVGIAGPTPLNVTIATGTNITQIAGNNIASPTGYGTAPVGSVQGVNAFVTNNVNVTTPTPLQITLPASPISVGIAGPTPLNVTVGGIVSPQGVTIANSPVAVNQVQSQGINIASPSTYGVAPVGSVPGINAFVTNTPTVLLSGTPISIVQTQSPQNMTLNNSPIAVTIASSPVNITGSITANSASPTNVNLDQINGQLIASPQSYGTAPNGSVMGVNAFVTNNVNVTTPTPLQVTLPGTPLNVTVAGPTPLNVTVASPQANNLTQIQNVNVASPSTYGAAPVGSVLGVNAFVTNNVTVTPPTPLQITLPASPISVGIAGPTPLNVTVGGIVSPQGVTIANSPVAVNQVQSQGVNIASPSTYGVAPVGSVPGINAFVTNNVNVTPPTPLNVTVGGIVSPQNVTIAGPTPLAVTLPSTPVLVAISTVSSPVNVTGSFTATSSSPTTINIAQLQNVNLASPSTYGVAPVGSVMGENAFVTNVNPNGSATSANSSPVVIASDQTPVSMNITQVQSNKIASPTTYGVAPTGSVMGENAFVTNVNPNGSATSANSSPVVVASDQTPISVNIGGPGVASQAAVNLIQVQGTKIASPSTYGVAPVGSVEGVNAFVTSLPASPLAVYLTPQSIALGLAVPASATVAYVATNSFALTGTLVALGATPGIVGVHQLGSASCSSPTPNGTPASGYLRFFDTTPHASGFDIALTVGTQSLGTTFLAVVGSPIQQTQVTFAPPGLQFNKGIVVAFTQGPVGSSTAVGYNIHCSFGYN